MSHLLCYATPFFGGGMNTKIKFLAVLIALSSIPFFSCETEVSAPKDFSTDKTRYSLDIPEEVDADLYRISIIDSSDTITYYEKAVDKKIQVATSSSTASKIVVEAFKDNTSIFTAGADISSSKNGKINLHKIEVIGIEIPQSPSGLVAKAQSQTAIQVTWNSVANAESYIVQYASSIDNRFTDQETSSTTLELTGLLNATTYTIRVIAKNTAGQSAASTDISCTTLAELIVKPAVPYNVKATGLSEKSISVTWDNVTGASSYSIMYSTQATGNFTTKTTSVNNYVIESLIASTMYSIKVATVDNDGSSSEYSVLITAKTLDPAQQIPSIPTLTAIMVSDTSLKISWGAVAGASTYIIERSLAISGSYTPICTTSALSFTDINCPPNATSFYKGKAVNSAGASQYSTVISAKTEIMLIAPSGLSQGVVTDTSIEISWDAVPGSSSYKVYSTTSPSGTYLENGTSNSTDYTLNKLTASTTYYIKVSTVNGSRESPLSLPISTTTMTSLPVPTGLTATTTSAYSITVKFNVVTGITRYKLYTSTNNSTFTVLSSLTGTTYTHSGLTANTTYYYKVSSVNDVIESAQSASVSAKTQTAVTKKAVIQSNCNGCGRCPPVCVPKAITRSGSKYIVDPAKCDGCGKCVTVCPRGAIKLQ